MIIDVSPIGYVHTARTSAADDFWGGQEASIELVPDFTAAALQGLDEFSHVEILFFLHEVPTSKIVTGACHPRDNRDWPEVGIFAQRGKRRPNRLGSTICRVLGCEGSRLVVAELDAIDGTPVLDIKPVMMEFLPHEPVTQPAWSHELMRDYWSRGQWDRRT